MFYYLSELRDWYSPLRMFQYITVRTVCAAGMAFLMSVIAGPKLIEQLRKFKIGQIIRTHEAPDLYALHVGKKGTPTMGGILIILSILISTILWAKPGSIFITSALCTMCYMGLVGFWDDYLKIINNRSRGLKGQKKLFLETLWVVVLVSVLMLVPETASSARMFVVPFIKTPILENAGFIFVFIFALLVIVGSSNAVNLTDGLDGLAIGCSGSVALSYMVMSYVAGNAVFSQYLNIPYVAGSGELSVFCGALLGACLGFLWYNCHPAQVFMGDTGSLALGGSIAVVAVLIKQELALVIVGGVFVIEALSVILQVVSFKLTGRRIFAMAPIHHHFEMKKWSETQVTIRFWIISIIFAILGILTLKIR